jgi:hypothetical protein
LLSHVSIFGPPTNDHDLDTEGVDDLAQKLAAAMEWFDERQPKVRPGQRQRYPGQAGPTTDVRNPFASFQQFRDRGAIQYVAIPQSVDFAWSQQAPLDSRARQNFGVPLDTTRL